MENLMYFVRYAKDSDGMMAHMETHETRVPINIHLEEGSDLNLKEGTLCKVDLNASAYMLNHYDNEQEFINAKNDMNSRSIIPWGISPLAPDDSSCSQSPLIIFSGKVTILQYRDDPNHENAINLRFFVESYELNFWLYWRNMPSTIWLHDGMCLQGVAWLYGTVKSAKIDSDTSE